MPINTDVTISRFEDGVLTVAMAPPVAVGGWAITFRVQKYFGGGSSLASGLINKSVSSGLNGASGITVTNSGQGVFAIDLRSVDTSGLQFGNYAYAVERTDSGNRTVLSQGYVLLGPSVG